MARELGWSDADILKAALTNEYGATHRRELILKWGKYMGLEASEALRTAKNAHLIPTAAAPRKKKETPPRKTQESVPE